jgi:hypothetical protein
MVEEWRPVVGFEDGYEVSDLGRVRSIDRIKVYTRVDQYSGKTLTVTRRHKGRILRPAPHTESDHLMVVLGRRKNRDVHRLVLEAFVGPCPPGQESLHDNDQSQDNRLSNLRWGTRSENLYDAVRNGKKAVGDKFSGSKLRAANISDIRSRVHGPRGSIAELVREYGVSYATIYQVRDGKTWKHVP